MLVRMAVLYELLVAGLGAEPAPAGAPRAAEPALAAPA